MLSSYNNLHRLGLLAVLITAFALPVHGQPINFTLIAGGELSTHRLVSPLDAGGLEFEFEIMQTKAEAEQSFFVGARVDCELTKRLGLQFQADYGRVIYNVFFSDPLEDNGIFGPLTRGVFYAPKRLDFSIVPAYTVNFGNLSIVPKGGFTYSLPVAAEEYTNKIPQQSGQARSVAIQNALNRAFGGPVWKVNLGIDVVFDRFLLFANWRHQISSASTRVVLVKEHDLEIPFDNRLTAIQIGLGYRLFR